MIGDFTPLPAAPDAEPFERFLQQADPGLRPIFEQAASVLSPLLSASPYLLGLACRHAGFLHRALQGEAEETCSAILARVAGLSPETVSMQELSLVLRTAKAEMALLAAVAETGSIWPPERAAMALSDLADACLRAALDFLVAEAVQEGRFSQQADQPVRGGNCGLCVFALGKHGGRELNYSSDIDIVAFFDAASAPLADSADASRTYSRIVRKLAALMQERTEHGYVFRTDLRLRPDPGSTPVALSVEGALTYYEARGQNWERAAWIKARIAAGDEGVGRRFLDELAPFIWRKHLDFATIADIQAMKRQINIARNVGAERVGGHNVKLGRGGIREIEFFAQTQQLIAGGREKNLRVIPTVAALGELAASNWITPETAQQMSGAYWFLRAVENRIQMINDQQTHVLPEDETALAAIARLMGYQDLAAFEAAYRKNLEIVTCNYTNLFAEQNELSAQGGSLVFTGTDDDPATLETLSSLGFHEPAKASATIRKWQYGGYPATRAAAARAHLTELLPALLQNIARAGNADTALRRFDDFLSRLPAGVQLFAMLRAHDQLCQLLVAFMASAPRMAEAVIRRAHVLDGLIDPARTAEIVDPGVLEDKINAFLEEARFFEDVIDRARIIGQEQSFLISAGLISGSISADLAARQFSILAQTLLRQVFDRVRQVFEQRHGRVKGAELALLAFGRLGSQQMNAASDLDVILLYDAPENSEFSDGKKPLDVSLYFTRLTQRLISAISAQTAEGVLYEVDMRLRPSGNAGPLATSLSAFELYQEQKAWTWEHQALTRARVIYDSGGFGHRVETGIGQALSFPRDREKLARDVVEMRQRLLRDRPPRHDLDLKLAEGGLLDIEFMAQFAVLADPQGLCPVRRDTLAVLEQLHERGELPQARTLSSAYELMSAIVQISTSCLVRPADKDQWTDAFRDLLARLTNYPDFDRLQQDVARMKEEVRQAFARFLHHS